MEIVYRKLVDLKPHPDNPRKVKDENAIADFAEKIRTNPKHFEARPILLSNRTGELVIIGGERRWESAAYLGWESAPTILIEGLTEDEETRILFEDNTHIGIWDEKKLAQWDKKKLQGWGVELPKWEKPKKETAQITEDDFNPDKKVKSRCRPGDIWQLGQHRLLCGDSTEYSNFVRLCKDKIARLVVTSPPYGVGKSYEECGLKPWKDTVYAVIDNITKFSRIVVWNIGDLFATGNQFIEPTSMYSTARFNECGFGLMYSRIWHKQGGNFAGTNPYYTVTMKPVQEYEWILGYAKKDYEQDYKPIIDYLASEAKKAQLKNSLLKEITGAGFMYGHWFTSHQFAMIDEANYVKIQEYCKSKGIKAFEKEYSIIKRQYDNMNIFGKLLTKEEESEWGQWAIWNFATVNKRTYGHPAEFPIELPARCIKLHSRENDIILEPFCGAGTTLIACEQLNRICYGIERDPHFCDIILTRWEEFTGQKAVKIEQ